MTLNNLLFNIIFHQFCC